MQGGFYYYSGMTKPTNQETMATEMILYNSQFPRGGSTLFRDSEEALGSVLSRKSKGMT